MVILPVKTRNRHCRPGFTCVDAVVITLVVGILMVVFLPVLAGGRRHPSHFNCVNNLKQTGIAFRIWEGDNNDKYPMAVSVTNGGAQELIIGGKVADCFRVMSNELATPKILVCPQDSRRQFATNFDCLNRLNISYFIGVDSAEADPLSVISGDDNLMLNHHQLLSGVITPGLHTFTWTRDRHQSSGNVLMADGSVQTVTQIRAGLIAGDSFATNRIAIP